jgi:cardiolipin synthase
LKPHDIPNVITALRIVLVAPILWLLLQASYGEALLLFLIAGLSDGVDGFLAKRFNWTSRLGGILDPMADKLLLMGAILVLGWQGDLPIWLVAMVIFRDVVIVIGAISYHFLIEPVEPTPLLVSKLNTLMQIVLVIVVLFHKGVIGLPESLVNALVYCAALTTLLSGAAYVKGWGERALEKGERGVEKRERRIGGGGKAADMGGNSEESR